MTPKQPKPLIILVIKNRFVWAITNKNAPFTNQCNTGRYPHFIGYKEDLLSVKNPPFQPSELVARKVTNPGSSPKTLK